MTYVWQKKCMVEAERRFPEHIMNRENREDWRKICKDALHEKDPERLHSLLSELAIALERRRPDVTGQDVTGTDKARSPRKAPPQFFVAVLPRT